MDRRSFLLGSACFCGSCASALAQGDDPFERPRRRPVAEPGGVPARLCGTPQPSLRDQARAAKAIRAFRNINRAFVETIIIPVHYHVIHNGAAGKVPENQIIAQHRVLQADYAATNMEFLHRGVTYTDKPEWYELQVDSAAEREVKTTLGTNIGGSLNIYLANICKQSPGDGLLGWATFPWWLESDAAMDGVVLLNASLPGGAAQKFNLGKTATHEIGHWLGLFHTFQNGCDDPGNSVDDTPYEEAPAFGCPVGRKTCSGTPGDDPIHNYMDYSQDSCLTEFTPLQIARVRALTAIHRTRLLSDSARASLVLEAD